MKNQYRTTRHCPPEDKPEHFTVLIDGVVYKFAKSFVQFPDKVADNASVYNVFIEDGLIDKGE